MHHHDLEVFCLVLLGLCCICLLKLKAQSILQYTMWVNQAVAFVGYAVVITDKFGNIKYFNEVAEKHVGRKLNDMAGKPVSTIIKFINYDTRNTIEDPIHKAIGTGAMFRQEKNTVIVLPDGREFPVDSSVIPIAGKRSIRAVVLIFRDITARHFAEQELLESEERLRAVTNAVKIGLVMINRDHRYTYANNFYKEISGIAEGNIVGRYVREVVPLLYESILPNLNRAFAGERVNYTISGIHKKELGLNRLYSVTYEPQMRNAMVINVIIVVQDITDKQGQANA